jgi:hypothetical protein
MYRSRHGDRGQHGSFTVLVLAIVAFASSVQAQTPQDATELTAIAKRVQLLEFPEATDRKPEEIQILRTKAAAKHEVFRKVVALHREGLPGGDTAAVALVGAELANAKAELAFAQKDLEGALRHLAVSVKQARRGVEAAQAMYDAGQVGVDYLLRAVDRRAAAELALIRGLRLPGVANVDLVKIDLPIPLVSETAMPDEATLGDAYYLPEKVQ